MADQGSRVAFQISYSALDRLIHRLAFAAPAVQLTAADIEKAIFRETYSSVKVERPIFVTSLPRAGTTLLLELLCRFPGVATHTYRDMPFVMAPVFWSKVFGSFRKKAEQRERAHGDGFMVGYDSPEAFEEIIWRTFWPQKYVETIALWGATDLDNDARKFFVDHMRKIIALRCIDRLQHGRYVSKNNANVARLELLNVMFPEARIVVPVRDPVEHAISLWRQHRNFLEMHAAEPFARRYMEDIGHYEFGELHRPIAFPRSAELLPGRVPREPDYWLAYWIAGFEYIAERRDRLVIVSYEALCMEGLPALTELSRVLGLAGRGALEQGAALLHPPPAPRGGEVDFDATLVERARTIHAELLRDR